MPIMAPGKHIIGLAVVTFAVFAAGMRAFSAQLDAPGAFSDFADCKHDTCMWVPWDAHKSFQRGDYSYTIDNLNEDDSKGDFALLRKGQELFRTPLKDLSASVSVVWSRDSHFFAVTWSDGGAIGNFHVRAFRVQDDAVTELPVTRKAFASFKARHWCEERGDNIQAYRWTADSKSLVLVLSVYPTGDCGAQLGHTEGFVVDALTGRIKENWNVRQLNAYIRSHPEM